MSATVCEFCQRDKCPRAADPVVFAADWEDCLRATAARADAAEAKVADLGENFARVGANRNCIGGCGFESALGECEAERDTLRAQLAAAQKRIEAGVAVCDEHDLPQPDAPAVRFDRVNYGHGRADAAKLIRAALTGGESAALPDVKEAGDGK